MQDDKYLLPEEVNEIDLSKVLLQLILERTKTDLPS